MVELSLGLELSDALKHLHMLLKMGHMQLWKLIEQLVLAQGKSMDSSWRKLRLDWVS